MSDEKDTDARPDELDEELNEEATEPMTEDELVKYRRLRTKLEEDAQAKAAAAQKEKDEEVADRAEEAIERQRHHVIVRHTGRGPKTRTMRAARSGHRRQGVLLDDGTRIRKKGRQRAQQLSLERLVSNHKSLLEYVRVGQIEVCEPFHLEAIPYPELLNMIMEMGQWLFEKRKHEAAVVYDEAMVKYEEALEEWKERVKTAKKAKVALPPEPTKPELEELPDSFELDPEVKYPDEPVEKMPSALDDAEPTSPRPDDVTLEDIDTSAVTAAVDQANAEKSGEANLPPSETGAGESEDEAGGEELGEADLRKMSRAELDDIAKDNKLDPSNYSKKEELIEALLSLGEEE